MKPALNLNGFGLSSFPEIRMGNLCSSWDKYVRQIASASERCLHMFLGRIDKYVKVIPGLSSRFQLCLPC